MKCLTALFLVVKNIKITSSLVSERKCEAACDCVTRHSAVKIWKTVPLSSFSGIYVCSECGHELFSSMSKFEHSSPWPAFSQTIREDSVSKHPEAWGPIKVVNNIC